jgi:hypothetical protein
MPPTSGDRAGQAAAMSDPDNYRWFRGRWHDELYPSGSLRDDFEIGPATLHRIGVLRRLNRAICAGDGDDRVTGRNAGERCIPTLNRIMRGARMAPYPATARAGLPAMAAMPVRTKVGMARNSVCPGAGRRQTTSAASATQ